MGEVFRSWDRLAGQWVALKRVYGPCRTAPPPTLENPSRKLSLDPAATLALGPGLEFTMSASDIAGTAPTPPHLGTSRGFELLTNAKAQALRLHLTQEFRTLASLRHPHIVSVLDYGFDRDQQPYFTMELLEGAVPLDVAARDQPFSVRIGLLLQVLQALGYLHRRCVIHRDLKPGNILVLWRPDGPQVKLLDFGLSLLARSVDSHHAALAGTLGYIAPEVFHGAWPSEASDLFAVGVIAHELLLGSHPFAAQNTEALLEKYLRPEPIFSEDPRLAAGMAAVLRRALCGDPADRHRDAWEFSQELARAAGLALPAETPEIRESFLRAATFVARDEELATLRHALDQAAAGAGALWMVAGESGVGKSRLLDELRTLALVRGVRVVRSQAVNAGGAAYQIWQEALRPLCLDAALDDLEAGVLRSVVPDIATLLSRPIPEPPALDPQSAQARLLLLIENLLVSQRQPLVLLLEDLHWAEPASLAVLQRLRRVVARHPLLVIGSYRQDEHPTLLEELPGAQVLCLQRFSGAELALLSTSMLGAVGGHPQIVSLLERETAGNAFFVVEVIRALAEEVGALGRVGSGRVPSRMAAGGVQAVLTRRLGRVSAEARPLLCAAAVLGRELDLAVLRALPQELGAQVELHLSACATALVLEVSEDRWRFAHDKLREAVLAELTPAAQARWHRLIGEAMEQSYAQKLDAHAAALGYHFDEAGEPVRALPYRLRAGELAIRDGAVHDAIRHLERAMELQRQVPCPRAERAQALRLLSSAYQGAGRPKECVLILEQMFADAGMPIPCTDFQLAVATTRLAARHARTRLSARSSADTVPARGWMDEVSDAVMGAGEAIATTYSPGRTIHLFLAHVDIAERLGDPARLAPAYSALALCFLAPPLRWMSASYIRQAWQFLGQTPNPSVRARAYVSMLEAVIHVTNGDWEQANRCLHAEIEDRRRIGDWRQEILALNQLAAVELWQGKGQAGLHSLLNLVEICDRVDIAQYAGWARASLAYMYLERGELGRAGEFLGEAEAQEPRANDRTLSIALPAYRALYCLRSGDPQGARGHADAAQERLLAGMPLSYSMASSLPVLVEIYFTLWSAAADGEARTALRRPLKQSLARLQQLGALFPICRSRAFLWHGQYALFRGHTALAKWLLRQALRTAERCQMPMDRAFAHQALAALAAACGDLKQAKEEDRAARELFTQLSAYWYLDNDPATNYKE